MPITASIRAGMDQREKTTHQIERALAAKLGALGPEEVRNEAEAGNELIAGRLVRMADAYCDAFGLEAKDPAGRVGHLIRAFGTGDLGGAFRNVANTLVSRAFVGTSEIWPMLVREGFTTDFRAFDRSGVGMAGALPAKPEHGEYKPGALRVETETMALGAYGALFPLTRELFLNDAEGHLADIFRDGGAAAALTIGERYSADLTANPAFAPDGEDIFSAAHNNVGTSIDAGAPTVVTISHGRQLLRRQRYVGDLGLTGRAHYLNTPARYLVVPAALEAQAEQAIASEFRPSTGEEQITVLVDSRLDDDSATQWYLFADPERLPVYEVAGLDGPARPRTEIEYDAERDVYQIGVKLDFAGGFIDFRGAYRNDGA